MPKSSEKFFIVSTPNGTTLTNGFVPMVLTAGFQWSEDFSLASLYSAQVGKAILRQLAFPCELQSEDGKKVIAKLAYELKFSDV